MTFLVWLLMHMQHWYSCKSCSATHNSVGVVTWFAPADAGVAAAVVVGAVAGGVVVAGAVVGVGVAVALAGGIAVVTGAGSGAELVVAVAVAAGGPASASSTSTARDNGKRPGGRGSLHRAHRHIGLFADQHMLLELAPATHMSSHVFSSLVPSNRAPKRTMQHEAVHDGEGADRKRLHVPARPASACLHVPGKPTTSRPTASCVHKVEWLAAAKVAIASA